MLNRFLRRGLHGYSHENPVKMNLEQQHAILDKTYKDLTKFCGKPPRGNVAPVSYPSLSNFVLILLHFESRESSQE